MPGNHTGSTYSVSPSATTTYSVQVTDANGCSASDNVVVNINSLPTANAGANRAICTGGSVTLN